MEDYSDDQQHGKLHILIWSVDSQMMGSEGDMEGMVYQDEDGNLIMYGDQMMGSEDEDDEGHQDDDMMGDSYGMEGSPANVSILSLIQI